MTATQRILAGTLAMSALLLSACGDKDNAGAKSSFKFDGAAAVSLEGAVLYVVNEAEDGNGHTVRDYAITDGEYLDGDGLSLGDYTGVSYLMVIRLGVPDDAALAAGEYPLYHTFTDVPETSRISWVSFTTTANVFYETPAGAMGEQYVEISGNYDHGDIMTITFTGTLTHQATNEVPAEGRFYFRGEVTDLRFMAARRASR